MFGNTNDSPLPQLNTVGSPVQFTGECSSKSLVDICQFTVPEATDAKVTLLLRFKARMKVFNGSSVWVDKEYFSIANLDRAPRAVNVEYGPYADGDPYEIVSGSNRYKNYLQIQLYRNANTEFALKALCYCYATGNLTGNLLGSLTVTGTAELITPYSSGILYTSNYTAVKPDFIPA